MTIRSLTLRTSIILAGAALATSMAFAESQRYDRSLEILAQGSTPEVFQTPMSPDAMGRREGRMDRR